MPGEGSIPPITIMHWARGLASGLLLGAAFVGVAMLVEAEVVKAGASQLFSRNPAS